MAYNRKEIVKRLRKEGREAFFAGKNRQQCPYRYMDQYQWLQGFSWAEHEADAANVIVNTEEDHEDSTACLEKAPAV